MFEFLLEGVECFFCSDCHLCGACNSHSSSSSTRSVMHRIALRVESHGTKMEGNGTCENNGGK